MTGRIFLHIGLPKTGSTSFQRVLGENRRALRKQGKRFFKGTRSDDNHVDLLLSTIRPGVETFPSLRHKVPSQTALWDKLHKRIARLNNRAGDDDLIFSTEALAFLRTPDEIDRLTALFPTERPITILVVLRDKTSFLESYTKQIVKMPGRVPSENPQSSLYVGKDAWITDYDALLAAYRGGFQHVQVFDYHPTNVVPQLLAAMDVDLGDAPASVFHNVT